MNGILASFNPPVQAGQPLRIYKIEKKKRKKKKEKQEKQIVSFLKRMFNKLALKILPGG